MNQVSVTNKSVGCDMNRLILNLICRSKLSELTKPIYPDRTRRTKSFENRPWPNDCNRLASCFSVSSHRLVKPSLENPFICPDSSTTVSSWRTRILPKCETDPNGLKSADKIEQTQAIVNTLLVASIAANWDRWKTGFYPTEYNRVVIVSLLQPRHPGMVEYWCFPPSLHWPLENRIRWTPGKWSQKSWWNKLDNKWLISNGLLCTGKSLIEGAEKYAMSVSSVYACIDRIGKLETFCPSKYYSVLHSCHPERLGV